jgi:hypothetical protein
VRESLENHLSVSSAYSPSEKTIVKPEDLTRLNATRNRCLFRLSHPSD